jgi:hypothetical protein
MQGSAESGHPFESGESGYAVGSFGLEARHGGIVVMAAV